MSTYTKELEFAKKLAKQAGGIMLQHFNKTALAVEWKEDNTPVTIADKEINKLVIERIKSQFPEDGVLGEEESYQSDKSRLWVVDPIDGTQPFSIGIPLSTFSLGLVVEDKAILGVIYDPFQDRLYHSDAEKSFIGDTKLRVSSATDLSQSYVVLSSRMGGKYKETGAALDDIIKAEGKVFNFRSIIYGFMMVATGNAVAAAAGYCQPWDIAAALPILNACGAKVTDFEGRPITYTDVSNGILVSNGKVHEQMLELISP
jgi:fructose-1,6-bisphosphatase/inositol monophosphatase family enzyme